MIATPRRLRAASRAAAWAAAAMALLWAGSYVLTMADGRGRWGVALGRGMLGVAHADTQVRGDWPRDIDYPLWMLNSGAVRVTMWSQSAWRPSTNDATMTVGTVPPATFTFGFLWMPLWNFVVVAGLAAVGLRWAATRRRSYECAACGYDLRGAAHVVCPECGAQTPGALPRTSADA